ncbi:MAG: methyltransferase domain-containing protein [Minisyncoccia bacterium]
MKRYPHIIPLLLSGQSMARIAMNQALAGTKLSGITIDVGGGRSPDYLPYLDTSALTSLEPVDGRLSGIDFEKDPLPYKSGSIDTVLLCNTLEHVYNHAFLIGECARILKKAGTLVGFVPFFVGYHPDPEDYFRYTRAALIRLLGERFGEVMITEAGGGPFLANFNTLCLSLPRILRPLAYLCYALLDAVFLFFRPQARVRTPLGYAFTARTPHA